MKTLAWMLTIAALLAALLAGCGGNSHGASTKQAATGSSSAATPAAAHVPNPFRIVARYSAASLGLKNPRDLAIGPHGNLYITDAMDRVTVVSPAGKVLRRWGRKGTKAGDFSFAVLDPKDPSFIAASIAVGPNGDVYVSDSGNGRVEIFSPAGAFIRTLGGYGVGPGRFVQPWDLAVGPSGAVYVVDYQQGNVSKLSPNGNSLWSIGGPTAANSQLQGEISVANVDSHGRLVASSDEQQAIVYVDGSGHEVDSLHTTGDFPSKDVGPCGVTVDRAGDTFVTSCGSSLNTSCYGVAPPAPCSDHFELVFDRTHRLVGAWYRTPFLSDPGLSPRFGPRGESFAIGADGSVLKLNVALPGA
jgi:streptogramin lyase